MSIAGFGFAGPLVGLRVFDNMIQAASGMASVQGGEGDPQFVRQLAIDKITALAAAQAITAALFARERGAGGQHVRLNMLDTAVAYLWPDAGTPHTLLGEGVAVSPAGGGSSDLTRFVDGFGTAVPVSDAEFRAYCRAFGVEWVADDPRYTTLAARLTDPDWPAVWRDVVQAVARQVPLADALARLTAADVPNVASVPIGEVPDSPQVVANGTFVAAEHPVAGPLRQPAPPARFEATPAEAAGPAPGFGEHTDEILAELGYDETHRRSGRGAVARGGSGGVTAQKRTISVTGRSDAPPEKVFALLEDATTWKDWTRFPIARYEREGDPPPHGVGAIRNLGTRLSSLARRSSPTTRRATSRT